MQYLCVHGHFYQPPRENPSLESVEFQDSAYPYHDWNEHVTAECYAPNAAARILDGENRIVKITNNYSKISFNFGPTLLSWLQEKFPRVYQSILEGDRESATRYSGHASALAQAYNHMIMPLANRCDKITQVKWGIRDFQHRFGRDPEGMWLPETAVDLQTLDILAEAGIKFTILAPRQASRVRRIGGRSWKDVSGDRIDPTRAYQVRLPSKRKMALFFYDGPISRAVAFEGLLGNGEQFANRLLSGLSQQRDWAQLMHIATDGESYGHHHRFGEMALAYALDYIEEKHLAKLTNYGEYLEKNPPAHEVEIFENSSWSCVHGVERWNSNCGCNSGGHADWNQQWRGPLRQALDWLRDTLAPKYEEKARALLTDPWPARNAYIDVILDRSDESLARFFQQHAVRELNQAEQITALKLLEMQRHAMLMYTSCGWFFDELSGIETVQVIQYAGRAIHLANELFEGSVEPGFLEKMALAKSNIPEHRDGALIYEKFVKPALADFPKLAAHYAISSMFQSYPDQAKIYCYGVDRNDYTIQEAGKMKLSVGRARFTSQITRESSALSFGVIYLGEHNVAGGVRQFENEQASSETKKELIDAFSRADSTEVIRLLDKEFGKNIYSLKSLFRDEQNRIVSLILENTLREVEAANRRIYEQHVPLIRFLADAGMPQPRIFHLMGEFAINGQIRKELESENPDVNRIQALLNEAALMKVPLDRQTLEFVIKKKAEQAAEDFSSAPADLKRLEELENAVNMASSMPFQVNLWEVQNVYAQNMNGIYSERRARAEQGDEGARAWIEHFNAVADKLHLRVG
jgi:alpha-amylase/alpha-mannosidase (GH57 family)